MRAQRDFVMSLPEAWKREPSQVVVGKGAIGGSMAFRSGPLMVGDDDDVTVVDPICAYPTLKSSLRGTTLTLTGRADMWTFVTESMSRVFDAPQLTPTEALKQQAREAAEGPEGERRLEQVWQSVDGVVTVIEGKMRVLLTASRLRAPEVSPSVAEAFKVLADHDAAAHAKRLVSAMFEALPRAQDATEISAGPPGVIEVRLFGEVTWLISAPRLPWPGTAVRAYFPRSPGSVQLDAETFHLAPTLIERTKQALENAP